MEDKHNKNSSKQKNKFGGANDGKTVDNELTTGGRIKIVNVVSCPTSILCCKYFEAGKKLAVGLTNGCVALYNSSNLDFIKNLSDSDTENKQTSVTDIQKSSRNPKNLYCTYTNGLVKNWSLESHKCLYTIKENRQILGITYHPTMPKFLTYGDDGKLLLYDEETRKLERIFEKSGQKDKHDGHGSRVFAAVFHPDKPQEFVSGGWDNVVQFWDLRQSNALRYIPGIQICGKSLDVSPAGHVLVAAWQLKNPLQMFDFATCKLLKVLEPDTNISKLYCAKFVTKDFILTGGSEANLLRVIYCQNYTSSAYINNLPGGVYSFDIAPDKKGFLPKFSLVSSEKVYQVDSY